MKKLLVFQHVGREAPSRIGEWAADRGADLDVVKLWEPYVMPRVADYDGLVVLGGPMGAYDDFPSKEDEMEAIRTHVGEVPMLGVCLGAQLIAHAVGARVYPHEREGKRIKEIGHYTIELTPHGRESALFEGFPQTVEVLQWHGDTFDVPEGGKLLARAPLCESQAFSYGNAYGLQFHFEITASLLRIIAAADAEWSHTGFDLDEGRLFARADELEPVMKERCYRLMDNFLLGSHVEAAS